MKVEIAFPSISLSEALPSIPSIPSISLSEALPSIPSIPSMPPTNPMRSTPYPSSQPLPKKEKPEGVANYSLGNLLSDTATRGG
ncbi:MAG: hypothetical protein IKV04_06945 [Alistipes sp.]|nr:hypothetical protein [Alistipes sp.]